MEVSGENSPVLPVSSITLSISVLQRYKTEGGLQFIYIPLSIFVVQFFLPVVQKEEVRGILTEDSPVLPVSSFLFPFSASIFPYSGTEEEGGEGGFG